MYKSKWCGSMGSAESIWKFGKFGHRTGEADLIRVLNVGFDTRKEYDLV